jgi:catechol 2,3-dioxygenase-like lactoylglutathione lyase family enzyme
MSSASVSPNEKPMLGSAQLVAFVATRDPAKAKEFYRDTLGLGLVSEDGFAVVFDANGVMLRVSTVREIALAQYTVLGWEVSDIVAKVQELGQAGVKFERYSFPGQDEMGIWTAPGGMARVAWFKDPDGNVLSLSQHA